jgi:hypothetical protein
LPIWPAKLNWSFRKDEITSPGRPSEPNRGALALGDQFELECIAYAGKR